MIHLGYTRNIASRRIKYVGQSLGTGTDSRAWESTARTTSLQRMLKYESTASQSIDQNRISTLLETDPEILKYKQGHGSPLLKHGSHSWLTDWLDLIHVRYASSGSYETGQVKCLICCPMDSYTRVVLPLLGRGRSIFSIYRKEIKRSKNSSQKIVLEDHDTISQIILQLCFVNTISILFLFFHFFYGRTLHNDKIVLYNMNTWINPNDYYNLYKLKIRLYTCNPS